MGIRSLSGLDAGFLYIETPEAPMHVGALALFAYPESIDGSLIEHVRAHLAGRLHLSGVLNQRLALMPFDLGHPIWVNADEIDLGQHVRHARLPKPGSLAALEKLVAKLHAEPLDRSRPLWQFWIIEGLRDGGFALFTKVHHAALDGAAGVALAHALLDLGPCRHRPTRNPNRRRACAASSACCSRTPWRNTPSSRNRCRTSPRWPAAAPASCAMR